jgi:hypothetical protein
MTKVDTYRETLRTLGEWDSFLLEESGLPGRRANLELAYAVADEHNTSNSAVRRVYFLLKGVTAVCDLGSELDKMPEFEQDSISGPSAHGFRAGPIVTAPGGYPGIY